MRYHKDISVVNMNALDVAGRVFTSDLIINVICHLKVVVEMPWCYHSNESSLIKLSKDRIHLLK